MEIGYKRAEISALFLLDLGKEDYNTWELG